MIGFDSRITVSVGGTVVAPPAHVDRRSSGSVTEGTRLDLLAGIITAVANSFTSILSKGLTSRFPAAQLVFPLLTLNVLMVLPVAPFVEWAWTPSIMVLMFVSATLLVVGSFAMFELYDHGSPASAVTAQSLSPIPATLAVSLLLPGTLDPAQVVAAMVVLCAVLVGLNESFGILVAGGRRAPSSWRPWAPAC